MTEKFLTAHQFTNLVKSVIPLRHEFFWRFSLLDHQEMALKKHQNEINCSLKTVIKCYSMFSFLHAIQTMRNLIIQLQPHL